MNGKNYKPFLFFSSIAFILAMLSVLFFVPVFIEYINTGIVDKFPTLIVSGFTMLAAIQAFFSGMILSTINQKNKHDFEIDLHNAENRLKELKDK